MENLTYKISARAAILLGRENVSKVDGAIIELIKNSYDADATMCFIYFDKNAIYIIDNGTGMDKNAIENNWLTIGTDNKKENYVSKRNRIKSGEKGIGRLALDRLGEKYDLYTKTKHSHKIIHIATNWYDFEKNNKNLSDIPVFYEEFDDINEIFSTEKIFSDINFQNFESATIIKISGLRDEWDKSLFNKIKRMLGYLLPPTERGDFSLFFKDYIDNKKHEITNNVSEEYDYKIIADFNGEDFFITLYRNEFDVNKIPNYMYSEKAFSKYPYRKSDFIQKKFEYKYSIAQLLNTNDIEKISLAKKVGGFKFHYIFMKLSAGTNDIQKLYYKNISNNRKLWMEENSGIKIYRDDFVIRPYGDNKSNDSYDWLGLDARKAQSPAAISHPGMGWKVRNSQGQGTVFISRVKNEYILDKSSREGIIENKEFSILKEMIISIISIFEKDRAYIAKNFKIINDKKNEKETVKAKSTEIANKILQNKLTDATKNMPKDKDSETLAEAITYFSEEREELISEVKLLRSLSTNGLITSTIVHDLKTLSANLINRIDNLEYCITTRNNNLINEHLKTLKRDDCFLKSWISVLLNQTKNDRRKRKKENILSVINDSINIIKPILDAKQIKINNLPSAENMYKKIFVTDFETIIYNLIINSIESFERNPVPNRYINIQISYNQDKFIIDYEDSGKGIGDTFPDPYDIFNFGVTSKVNQNGEKVGTGLGMYIVASTVREYNGDCTLLEYKNKFKLRLSFEIGEI